MKNSVKLSFSFLVLCILILSSCTKEAPLQTKSTVNDSAAVANEGEEVCFNNPNNPYEYVGVQHNLGLDALAAIPGSENLSLEEAHEIADQLVSSNLGIDGESNYDIMQEAYENLGIEEPLKNATQLLFDEGTISVEAYNKLVELDQIIEDSEDAAGLASAVIDFENNILQESAYTTEELEIMLGSTAIAIHSSCYWTTVGLDANHPWHSYIAGEENNLAGVAQSRWGWNWIRKIIRRVIKSDIAGYQYGWQTTRKWRWVWGLGWIVVRVYKSVVTGIIWSYRAIY